MALSTSRTVLTQTGINTFLNYDIGGLNSAGIATFASFRGDGSQLTGIDATTIQTGTTKVVTSSTLISNQISGAGIATVQAGGLDVTGVVTATSFVGSGAALTGIDATAIQTGNTVVQTNASRIDSKVSNVGILTVTESGVNVTGIITANSFVSGGTATFNKISDSISMADSLVHTDNNGTKLQFHTNTLELHTSGEQRLQINSAGNLIFKSPNNNTGEQPAKLQWWNENSAGIMAKISVIREAVSQAPSALAFYTSPNVDSSANSGQGDITERLRITNTGAVLTGIFTAFGGNAGEGAFISPTAVGVGTTTLAGRNAGVSTATGTLVYNTTDNKLQVWMGTDWSDASTPPPLSATGGTKSTSSRSGYTVHTFFSPGTFSVATGTADSGDVEVFVVAGGGSGGGARHSGGGGAGAIRYSTTQTLAPGSYSVTVGSGGATGPQSSPGRNNGANSVFGSITATGGGGGGSHPWNDAGAPGGSGGGEAHSSVGAGTGSGDPGGSGTNSVSPNNGWGNNGGLVMQRSSGGGGGGSSVNGGNGQGSNENSTNTGGTGGDGLQYSTDGNTYYYAAGGGGSANPGSCEVQANGGPGGVGGGGGGAACGGRNSGGQSGGSGGGSARNGGSSGSASNSGPSNVCNGGNAGSGTGSGGGAAAGWAGYGGGTGGAGGPGLVIVAYPTALTT